MATRKMIALKMKLQCFTTRNGFPCFRQPDKCVKLEKPIAGILLKKVTHKLNLPFIKSIKIFLRKSTIRQIIHFLVVNRK
jgi:hypothetical protein